MKNKRRIIKSIRSLEKRKREHLSKIKKGKRENLDEGLMNYWEKETIVFNNEIKKEKQKLLK